METKQTAEETHIPPVQTAHPWLEVPESSLDDDLRYTLDEIRIA